MTNIENYGLLPNGYQAPSIAELRNKIDILEKMQGAVNINVQQQYNQPVQEMQTSTVLDDIRQEIESLSTTQQDMLFSDKKYKEKDTAIQGIALSKQMEILMPLVLNDENGKKALEAQLYCIRDIKKDIIEKEQKERKEFEKWKEQQINGNKKSGKQLNIEE